MENPQAQIESLLRNQHSSCLYRHEQSRQAFKPVMVRRSPIVNEWNDDHVLYSFSQNSPDRFVSSPYPSCQGDIQEDPATQFLNILIAARAKLENNLGKFDYGATMRHNMSTEEDSRVVDFHGRTKAASIGEKLRKVLSSRSLALEYDRWEFYYYRTSRIRELTLDPTIGPSRSEGHIGEFTRTKLFKSPRLAYNAIRYGIRLIVWERLLNISGSSVLVCAGWSIFARVPYSDLVYVASCVMNMKWVQQLLNDKCEWFEQYQNVYDLARSSKHVVENAQNPNGPERLLSTSEASICPTNMPSKISYGQSSHPRNETATLSTETQTPQYLSWANAAMNEDLIQKDVESLTSSEAATEDNTIPSLVNNDEMWSEAQWLHEDYLQVYEEWS